MGCQERQKHKIAMIKLSSAHIMVSCRYFKPATPEFAFCWRYERYERYERKMKTTGSASWMCTDYCMWCHRTAVKWRIPTAGRADWVLSRALGSGVKGQEPVTCCGSHPAPPGPAGRRGGWWTGWWTEHRVHYLLSVRPRAGRGEGPAGVELHCPPTQ